MSGHDKPVIAPLSVAAGALAATSVGVLAGAVTVFGWWAAPASITSGFGAFVWKVMAILLVGGVPGLIIGGILAWHGAVTGATTDRADGAPLWGVIAGIVLGASLCPVFAGAAGLVLGHLGCAIIMGVVTGPIIGVISWEAGFFAADYFRGARHA